MVLCGVGVGATHVWVEQCWDWHGVMLVAIVTPSIQQFTPHSRSRTGFSVPAKEGCGLMMNGDIIHGAAALMVNTTVE